MNRAYRCLPYIMFFYAVICWILHPNGAVRTGMLADSDDYMRLNEAINWLSGQGWFDLSHPRLSPGSNTIVHWSRLLDLPLAFVMLPFIKFIGMANAALIASFVVPPITFAALLWLAIELAKPFVGEERANLAAPLVLFAPLTLLNFVPGRVDHHGYEVLVAAFGLLTLERMASNKAKVNRYIYGCAVLFACGLWIGTEALPWVVLFVACLATIAAWEGGRLLQRATLFGGAFAAATLVILFLAVEPAEYTSLALSWYSAADVIFAVLVAAMFGGVYVVNRQFKINRQMRFGVMIISALLAAAVFYKIVPHLEQGPFADYDDFDSTIALAAIGEAQPMIHNFQINFSNHLQIVASLLTTIQLLLFPVAALIVLLRMIKRNSPKNRNLYMAHAVFLTVAIAATLLWQMRVGWFMQFFAIAPLTYLLVRLWRKIANRYEGRTKFALEVTAFAMLGFMPVILIPSMAHDAPLMSDVVLFPAARPAAACPLRTASDFLNQFYGDRPHTILSGANEGPELLFRTRQNVIAANFNVAGNEDVYNFFGARDDAEAKAIAAKWHADIVLVCRSFPLAYARLDHVKLGKTAFLSPGKDGKLQLVSNPQHPTLIERLVRSSPPPWLKPVEIPLDENYLLFEITK